MNEYSHKPGFVFAFFWLIGASASKTKIKEWLECGCHQNQPSGWQRISLGCRLNNKFFYGKNLQTQSAKTMSGGTKIHDQAPIDVQVYFVVFLRCPNTSDQVFADRWKAFRDKQKCACLVLSPHKWHLSEELVLNTETINKLIKTAKFKLESLKAASQGNALRRKEMEAVIVVIIFQSRYKLLSFITTSLIFQLPDG